MHIHYITNTRAGLKIGERNQALGVVDALRATYKDAILLEHDTHEIARLKEVLKKYARQLHIIIGVSETGVACFTQLSQTDNCINVLIGHEVPENAQDIINKIHILAIPSHVTDCPSGLEGITIIRTDGVAHTMTAAKAEIAYQDWQNRFPVADSQPVIVVMLGGVVDGKGYAPGEAEKMAEYITAKAKKMGAYIIASNSPRSKPQDTEEFTRLLSSSGCNSAFFPFDMKNQNNETPYRAMVGMVAKDTRNIIIVAGDSVSMPCEIAKVIPPEQLYIYPVSNYNRQNVAFIAWMIASGWAGLVNRGDGTETLVPQRTPAGKMDAAGQIAESVIGMIQAVIKP